MKRFSIRVRERGSDKESELCQVATNPEAIVDAARNKFLMIDAGDGRRKVREPKYEHVYFVEVE